MKIKVKNVSRKYHSNYILKDINIELTGGKIYGFVGKNASGKTLLFKIICGFVPMTSGDIYIDDKKLGKDIDFPPDSGVIIENPGFLENISGFKNLKILASINKKIDDKQIKDSMLEFGLDPNNNKIVKKYSLGMRQKLALCQALMENQKILILDEPMNGLDSDSVENIRTILKKSKEDGALILLSSHNKDDIDILCDEVYLVRDSKINLIE